MSARLADEAQGADVRNALFCLLALVTVLLQVVFVDSLALRGGGVPDIALVLVVIVGLTQGPFTGMLTGFSAGLALDLAPPGGYLIGASALVFCLIGYGCGHLGGRAGSRAYRASPIQLLVAVIAVAAGEAAVAAAGLVARGSGVTPSAAWQGLPAAVLYDAVLCAGLLAVAALVSRRSAARRSASLASGEPLRSAHGAFVPAQSGGTRSGAGRNGVGSYGAGRYAAIPIQAGRRSIAGNRAGAGEGSAPRAFSAGGSSVNRSGAQASSGQTYGAQTYGARGYSVRQYRPAAYPRLANGARGSAGGSRAYGSGSGASRSYGDGRQAYGNGARSYGNGSRSNGARSYGGGRPYGTARSSGTAGSSGAAGSSGRHRNARAGRADLGNGLRRHRPAPGQAGRTGARSQIGLTGRMSERAIRYRMSTRAFEHRSAGSRPGGTRAGSSRPRLPGTRRSGPRLDQGQSAMHHRREAASRRVRFRLKPERGGLRRQPGQSRRSGQARIRLRASRSRDAALGIAPVRPGGSLLLRLPLARFAMPRVRLLRLSSGRTSEPRIGAPRSGASRLGPGGFRLAWPLTGRPFPGASRRPFLRGHFRRQSRICRNAPRWTGAASLAAPRSQQGGGRRRFRNSGYLGKSGRVRNSGGARSLR
ncbi:MAG: hypothetical protein LBV34_08735 [Nocardiopsaceae bacterium]|nr:hypothetical protein [Nocardiopsaceae bacterium]